MLVSAVMDVSGKKDEGNVVLTGVATLKQVQNWVRKKRSTLAGHDKIEDVRGLMTWAVGKQIPDIAFKPEDLLEDTTYVVPQHTPDCDIEGVCITCRAEIEWLIQIVRSGAKWVLHIDGKHKLHHGGFLFITYGTHSMNYDFDKKKV